MKNILNTYKQLFHLYPSDKGTTHCYVQQFYNIFFENKQQFHNLLEIGVQEGYSIKLWSECFPNSLIYGIENDYKKIKIPTIQNNYHIYIADAYKESTVEMLNNKYDYIIDDGPHCLESQLFAVKKYTTLLNPKGCLIIEDIASDFNLNRLISSTNLRHEVFDFRHINNRQDDLILVIFKT